MKKCLPFIIKGLLIVFAVIGLIFTFQGSDFMSSSALLFFTVQSNIWILTIVAVFLVLDIIEKVKNVSIIPNWLRTVKFVLTVAITLTFVVFSVLLTPQMISSGNAAYLASMGNICVHNVVPILAILDWCLYDYKHKSKKYTFLLGTIMPLYYCIFALVGSTIPLDFGGGNKVPYFFLDYEANSWFGIGNGKLGTFYWIILLVGMVIGISYLLIFVKNKVALAKSKSQQATE